MKTAFFIAFFLALPVPAAYSQAAATSASTATQAAGTVQAGEHDRSVATSQAAEATSAAAVNKNSVAGATNESASAVTNAGKNGATAMQASDVSAQLTQKIDSRHAKVGDEVFARTTSAAQLNDGTKLPKGTRLMGKVTDVEPKSGSNHDGHLALAFDRAVLRDGRAIPVHTTLRSISAPAAVSAMGDTTDDFAVAGGPVVASGGGSAHAGGLLGGAHVPSAGGLVGGASPAVGNTAGRAEGVTSSTVGRAEGATRGTLHQGAGLVENTGGSAMATVHNLPGVSATTSASGSAVLEKSGGNVELSGGTQLLFSVAAN